MSRLRRGAGPPAGGKRPERGSAFRATRPAALAVEVKHVVHHAALVSRDQGA